MKKYLENFRWILVYALSSLGKKQMLGVAGACLVGFLGGHMLGNLKLLNPDPVAAQASYNAYCQFLTGLKPLIWIIEAVLVAILAVHAGLALKLKLENRKARGKIRYAVTARKGDAPLASYWMFSSGVLVLVFLVQHLLFIKFGDWYLYRNAEGEIIRDMWLTTIQAFANPWWTALYVLSLLALGAHLVHAIPSLFRTFGLAHRRWTPLFTLAGRLVAVVVILGFAAGVAGAGIQAQTERGRTLIQSSLDAQQTLQKETAK